VTLSNLPEGMSSSSGLERAGWPRGRVMAMWLVVVAVSALSAAAGYLLLDPASGWTGALVQAFAPWPPPATQPAERCSRGGRVPPPS
jgi:zinc transporter, ZIP family